MQWIRYTIELTPDAWAALLRHGYRPELPPRGTTGARRGEKPSTEVIQGSLYWTSTGSEYVHILLRNRVCELDGIEVDGHEGSDLDPGSSSCIHCDYEGPNP